MKRINTPNVLDIVLLTIKLNKSKIFACHLQGLRFVIDLQ